MTQSSRSFTDVIAQEFSLYIEGVQVPFVAMSVSSSAGGMPSANVVVPPLSGLMDIARYYSPKVHIFYTDTTDGTNSERLLFSGIITGVNYSKSIDAGNKNIEFNCQHKYFVLKDFLVDYTGWLKATTNPAAGGAVVKPSAFNSQSAILEALRGTERGYNPPSEVTPQNQDGDPATVPEYLKDFVPRLKGIPGIMLNYWQQLKKETMQPTMRPFADSFLRLYMPLLEDGLKFFQRMSGHGFIENKIEAGRTPYDCKTETKKVITPPSTKMFLVSAVQTDMAFRTMSNYLQSAGEVVNIYSMFQAMYDSIDYDMVTLASPAEATGFGTDGADTYAVDTIIKPKLPFYYSPSCNVLLPGMYTGINVSYDEVNIPTRVEFKNDEFPVAESLQITSTYFRAPHSIRKAVVSGINSQTSPNNLNKNLGNTTGPHFGKIGQYEQGRGILTERPLMPRWLSFYNQSRSADNAATGESWPSSGEDFDALNALSKGWAHRYPGEEALNPWTKESGVYAHQRLLFATAEQYMTQLVARSKAGSVSCPFNPYIIPGYPIDIIEASPNDPSFHGYCTSVTHNITSGSCSTSVSIAAAMTYTELVNYYVPFVHPWLQANLGLAEQNTIINNPNGLEIANQVYNGSLGKNVSAVAPDMLIDFSTGLPKPLSIGANGRLVPGTNFQSHKGENGGETNPNLTYQGNLTFVYREIESQESISTRDELTFIKLKPEVYNSTSFTYQDKSLLDQSEKFELGQSQFLTYEKYLEY